jgi:putative addiction module CopG family antidote
MNIIFSLKDESYIKNMVEQGFYHNATEFVRDAVRRMREREEANSFILAQALEIGEIAYKKGEFDEYSPKLLENLVKSAGDMPNDI